MHIVIMFELAHESENLTPMAQVNEAFGPFNDDEEAMKWAETASKLIRRRQWLIIPIVDPTVVNALDPRRG